MPARWHNSGAVPRPSLFERSAAWLAVAGFAASFFLFAPAAICAEEKNGSPRTEDILKKTIERAKWSEEHKFEAKYTYTQRGTFEELDSSENVKKREERVSQVFPIDGQPYARLILKDGKPLSDKEERVEQERERKFREGLAERRRKREQGKREDTELELNEELVSKYQFDLTGRERVNGRPAFVLSFQPKSADLPVKRKLDRLLNKRNQPGGLALGGERVGLGRDASLGAEVPVSFGADKGGRSGLATQLRGWLHRRPDSDQVTPHAIEAAEQRLPEN